MHSVSQVLFSTLVALTLTLLLLGSPKSTLTGGGGLTGPRLGGGPGGGISGFSPTASGSWTMPHRPPGT